MNGIIANEIVNNQLEACLVSYEYWDNSTNAAAFQMAMKASKLMREHNRSIFLHQTSGWKLITNSETKTNGFYYWKPRIIGTKRTPGQDGVLELIFEDGE